MPDQPSPPPKPVTEVWRPELVTLPRLTFGRRVMRSLLIVMMRVVAFFTMQITTHGFDNFPRKGPAVIVFNHLGDADAVLMAAVFPSSPEAMGKIELNDHWLVGPIFRAYGIIWVHRGRPDRKALRAALDALSQG